MKTRRCLFCLIICIFLSQAAFCQTNNQQLISSGGKVATAEGIQLDWSVGEISTETYTNNETSLTQGFHQGNIIISSIPNAPKIAELSIYPNPTSDMLIIDIEDFKPSETTNYQLYTVNGKQISNGSLIKKTIIDLKSLMVGTYLIKINNCHGKSSTFKIIKQ